MNLEKWNDPAYQAAKKARSDAYVEFCTVAAANPHLYGQEGFMEYYEAHTVPAREAFKAAHRTWMAETDRVQAGAGC